jgi:branched-subunit amino acid aminotransferase/4-amino-4-deoxychorismate lyase
VLVTPPARNVLHGVTRASVIEISKHDGRPVREEAIAPQALFEAAEVFLSGTTGNVIPVVSVDGRPVGEGRPGPVTQALRARFEEITAGRDRAFEHWLTFANEG